MGKFEGDENDKTAYPSWSLDQKGEHYATVFRVIKSHCLWCFFCTSFVFRDEIKLKGYKNDWSCVFCHVVIGENPGGVLPLPRIIALFRIKIFVTWPKFDTPFMTVAPDTISLNIIYEGSLLMVLSIMTRDVPSFKKHTLNSRLDCKSHTLFMTKPQIFVEILRRNLQSPDWIDATLVYVRGTPIWRPESGVNMWTCLELTLNSKRLIISTEQTSIYVSTFSNALTSEKDQNHEISILIFLAIFQQTVHLRLVPRTSITLNFKMLWFPNEAR